MLILFAAIAPKPVFYEEKETMFEVANLTFSCKLADGGDCMPSVDPVYAALNAALFPKGEPTPENAAASLTTVSFVLQSAEYAKDIELTDESYEIFVNATGIFVTCNTGDGVARAFASLAQMVVSRKGEKFVTGRYAIAESHVQDKAEFKFRQLLIDSSRHFLPLSTMKR